MRVGRNPAVLAGIGGSLALALPAPATALSLEDVVGETLFSPGASFVAGFASGAVAVGGVLGVVALVRGLSRRAAARRPVPAPSERTSASVAVLDDVPAYRPRHMRPVDGEPAAGSVPAAPTPIEEPTSAVVPRAGAEPSTDSERRGPSHAARDYEDVAENYVSRLTFRERMALRAEGVAATLRARMDAGRMAGVPVIERADGTVGDVGTSWWTASVGADSIPSSFGIAAEDDPLAIPVDFSGMGRRLDAGLSRGFDAPPAGGEASHASISGRVAFVDEGAYPERRTVEELTADDDWAAALRSLDELVAAELPKRDPIVFIDSVGGADTLDEPDNLEPDTAFIPFRPPAGHPEVVDTESYVDYLIKDEFSKSSSNAVRRTSRRFLQVIEGGTQRSAHLAGSPSARPAHTPRHFSSTVAVEA